MIATLEKPKQIQQITLYYRQGASDKIYQAAIEPKGDRYVVNFAYGRRGSTLNTGTKTAVPVEYSAAQRIFDYLIQSKLAKGYTRAENGTPYRGGIQENRATGILPQLLNPIEEQVSAFLRDPSWCMQEKLDGKRLLLQKKNGVITAINRKGLVVGMPEPLHDEALQLPDDTIVDGECVAERFFAFDVLKLGGMPWLPQPYYLRIKAVERLFEDSNYEFLKLVSIYYLEGEKLDWFNAFQRLKREGVVFKLLQSPYTPGRPNSGGPQLKYKFYSTASCVVAAINDKRSVGLQLWDGKQFIPVGNVTIPPNEPIPTPGAIVEVRYLYAFTQSNNLYQPVYLGQRSDINPQECSVEQLKFKAETDSLDSEE